jgi:hypothetical protein
MKSGIFRKGMGGALAVCLLATGTASVAWAHHAGANFDMGKLYIYRGTVRNWLWENPHAWLYMQVTKGDGSSELWGFEAGGPNSLARIGLHANTLKPGDKVSVYAAPDRTGVHNAMLRKIVLGDGRELVLFGAPPPGTGPGAAPGGPPGPGGPPAGAAAPSPFPTVNVPAVEYK